MYGFGCDAIINPKIKNLPYLHFVYKKSENDKEYTEYKEKLRYILCLKTMEKQYIEAFIEWE